jgi:hypothetical protein
MPLDLGSAHHAFEGHADSHETALLSVEDHSTAASEATVAQWAPVEDFASDHATVLDHDHADANAHDDVAHIHDTDHPLAVADAGAVSGGSHAPLRGGSMAMASTGAALLAGETRLRGKKKQA